MHLDEEKNIVIGTKEPVGDVLLRLASRNVRQSDSLEVRRVRRHAIGAIMKEVAGDPLADKVGLGSSAVAARLMNRSVELVFDATLLDGLEEIASREAQMTTEFENESTAAGIMHASGIGADAQDVGLAEQDLAVANQAAELLHLIDTAQS